MRRGALFYVAAKEILQRGGVVFGCQYNDDMAVVHTAAESLEQVRPMRNSKYVQSAIGDTYKQAERHLKEGRPVLYSGTPCQIAGLYNYLGRDYEGLLTMDLICMCVTPPKMFAEYLERLEREAGSKPTFFDFRDKSEGWGNRWNRIEFEDASKNLRDAVEGKCIFQAVQFEAQHARDVQGLCLCEDGTVCGHYGRRLLGHTGYGCENRLPCRCYKGLCKHKKGPAVLRVAAAADCVGGAAV